MSYTLTSHALERLRLRFGVNTNEATTWINDIMRKARYVSTNTGGRMTYDYDDIRIIVGANKSVITIHHAMRLDFMRPVIEREIRKLQRESTRKIREQERHLAKMYGLLSEQMTNYANARNPQTRELVGGRMEETERHIEGTRRKIERMKDEVKAKVKAIEVIAE